MTIQWNESGYPAKHYEELRTVKKSSLQICSVMFAVTAVLFVGSTLDLVNAWVTAFAMALLVMGLASSLSAIYATMRHIRIIPYFARPLGDIDTYCAGYALAKYLRHLDAIATQQHVLPLSSFGFADDLAGETLKWFSPDLGLKSLNAIVSGIADAPPRIRAALEADLTKWHHALSKADEQGIQFCILLQHGNSTSGHEWAVRKGSAF
jgi:hypothetical protein